MSQYDLRIGPKIKAFRRQMGLQANKLSTQLGSNNWEKYLGLLQAYLLEDLIVFEKP